MKCSECMFENPEGMAFCGKCGANLEMICPQCNFTNPPQSKCCRECGRELVVTQESTSPAKKFLSALPGHSEMETIWRYLPRQLSDKILASRGKIEGVRKQVTVLFVDMQGYTPLAETLGEEEVYKVINRAYEYMITPVYECEGFVQELTGDGIMALFGAPVALEDAPTRACHAALRIQEQMHRLSTEIEAEHEMRSQVRMGIHTGPVVVGTVGTDFRMDFKAVGDTVNLASRLESMAEPGSILISEATHRLVEAYVHSTFEGERVVKGKRAPQRIYRLEGLKQRAVRFDMALRRGLTPFVGRRRELETLARCYYEACQGTIRTVDIVGEAGIGKSRLVHELRHQIEGEHCFFLQGYCTSYGDSSSFLPFIEVARTSFNLREGSNQEEVEGKLRRGMEVLGMPIDESLPFLLSLLGQKVEGEALRGLDGEIIGARTREVLLRLLRERCLLSPVLMVIDDMHWIDKASEELLLRVVESQEQMPLLLICAYRPHYRSPWGGLSHVEELRLESLAEDSSVRLVQQRLGTEDLSRELERLVVDKAEGNPLFIEEITRYLMGRGRILGKASQISFRSHEEAIPIPDTLHDMLMARVDQLKETAQTILQVASVVGRRFSLDVVRLVSGVNGAMAQFLRDLETQELISRETAEGRDEYRFKHALIQDAIYESLLKPRREELHQEVAEAIERSYPDRLSEWAEILAHHWSHTSRAEKAVYYLAMAGEKSLRVYSLGDAHRRFQQVVELIEGVPGCADDTLLADVLLSWARTYYYRHDFKGLIDMVQRHLSRVEAMGDTRHKSLLLFWQGFSHAYGMQYDEAKSLLEKALAVGEMLSDEECIGYACLGLMNLYASKPSEQPLDIVDRYGDRCLEIARKLGDVFLESYCLLWLYIQKWVSGKYNDARSFSLALLEVARRASDPRAMSMGLYALALVNINEERFEEALENAGEAISIAPDPTAHLAARIAKGMALALMGQSQEGFEILKEARNEAVEGGFLTIVFFGIEVPYGAAMMLAGQMAAGLRWIEEWIERCSELGNYARSALGHMILGDIYLQMVLGEKKLPLSMILRNLGFILRTIPFAARKARSHLEEAIRRARPVDMPGILAHSLLGLGLLYQRKKRIEEARQYLEEASHIAEPLESPLLSKKIGAALELLN